MIRKSSSATISPARFPDAVQHASGAPLIRDRCRFGVRYDPGSAAHHHSSRKTRVNALVVLRRARETAPKPVFRNDHAPKMDLEE
jgi:hypothetical protein